MKSPQERFNEACAVEIAYVYQTNLSQQMKEDLLLKFLSRAKAITEDKFCDPHLEIAQAAIALREAVRRAEVSGL